jgi:hypothetical protein
VHLRAIALHLAARLYGRQERRGNMKRALGKLCNHLGGTDTLTAADMVNREQSWRGDVRFRCLFGKRRFDLGNCNAVDLLLWPRIEQGSGLRKAS